MVKNHIRIVFMGTPEIAVASLQALLDNDFDVCAVLTAPDRPAGRGRKLRISPVKECALSNNVPVLQPENLKDPDFVNALASLNATLFVVVAFRMLPEQVWAMPSMGTFNLHASLLPQYRGAAPINRTIMNGEPLGGVSTFFLRHKIDTGNIIFREETPIGPDETAGEYHDRLMQIGAGLVIKTVKAIEKGNVIAQSQEELMAEGEVLKIAPKIFKEDCRINWNESGETIKNLIRGLSPYPGAFTEIPLENGNMMLIKVYKTAISHCDCSCDSGAIITDGKSFFKICCKDACVELLELQQAGKKRMKVTEFLAGLNTNVLKKSF